MNKDVYDKLEQSLKQMSYNFSMLPTENMFAFYCLTDDDKEQWIYIMMDVSKYIKMDGFYSFGGYSYKATRDQFLKRSNNDEVDFFYESFQRGEKFIIYCASHTKNAISARYDNMFYYLTDFMEKDDDLPSIVIDPYMMEDIFDV